jgi:preprotein translocase subunit SecF
MENINQNKVASPLGKGEVVCSIHTGSTANQALSHQRPRTDVQNDARTCTITREKSVRFVRQVFSDERITSTLIAIAYALAFCVLVVAFDL